MESHGTLKNHQKSWKSHGTSHTDKSSPSSRNLALISFTSHLVSCIHSNTSDYELLGEIEANPLVYGYWFLYPRPTKLEGGYTGFTLSVCPSVRPSVCRRHGFRSISQVCSGISISNFICMLMVAIGRSLLIFSDVTFKMAAWRPYCIFWFPDSNFTLVWISTSNFSSTILMYMGRSLLIFSNVIFKMAAWRPY